MNKIRTILWDWNGTLFDDLEYCRNIINKLLTDRNLPTLTSNRYKEIFTFPVKDYYEKAGFDFSKEDFSIPADQFMDGYNAKINQVDLHKNSEETLEYFHKKGLDQIIISAMKNDSLNESVKAKGITKYFKEISGIDNHYANGKLQNAKNIITKFELNPSECCFIGDTIHDHEVSENIGCECILISGGHQSENRLNKTGRLVISSIHELTKYL